MHAEEKKALKENSLIHQVNRAIEGFKHGPSRSTVYLIGGAVAILLIALLFRFFYRSAESTTSERWFELDQVIFPKQLEALLEKPDFKDTPQGRLVRYKEARRLLTMGLRDLGDPNSTSAKENVEKGTALYEELAKSAGKVPLLHQEALWGSAKGLETLGDIARAKEYYTKLVKDYPDSAMGKDAANRLKSLDSSDASELSKILAPSNK